MKRLGGRIRTALPDGGLEGFSLSSWWYRIRRAHAKDKLRKSRRAEALLTVQNLHWPALAKLLELYLMSRGYASVEPIRGLTCGSFTALAVKRNERMFIYFQPWAESRIGLEDLEFLVCTAYSIQASSCAYVTTGIFARSAKREANGVGIELIDGHVLQAFLNKLPMQSLEGSL